MRQIHSKGPKRNHRSHQPLTTIWIANDLLRFTRYMSQIFVVSVIEIV